MGLHKFLHFSTKNTCFQIFFLHFRQNPAKIAFLIKFSFIFTSQKVQIIYDIF